jgi:trk system potassium uptake protein
VVVFRRGRSAPGSAAADRFRHPAQVIASAFASAIAAGTVLLSLPFATESGKRADLVDALFTATSAVCVTGLVTVDTGGYWSTYGEVVIMGLVQVGGLGIMTLATLFAVLVSRRLGLRARLVAQAETQGVGLKDIRHVGRNIVIFTLVSEAIVAAILAARLMIAYEKPFGTAAYDAVFHSVSAFNNAGFSLYADNMMRFVADPWVSLTIAIAFIVGGVGFPVVFELARSWRRPRQWSILTRLTLGLSVLLLGLGTIVLTVAEYSNPKTLGPLSDPAKFLAGFFAAATPRSAGFNTIDTAAMTSEGWLFTDILMFIGGGSASPAGGIKVTTFGVLAFVIWAELRGETRVNIGRRRIPESNQRQALAIALLGIGLVALTTFVLLSLTAHDLDRVLFEAVSAVCTVGLSTGITAELPPAGHLLFVVLMFVGRIGPLSLYYGLALRERGRRFELPEERTIVG